jgi:hypothetical protein
MFEKMRKAAAIGWVVFAAHVVPDMNRNGWAGVVFDTVETKTVL